MSTTPEAGIDAGAFGVWLRSMRAVLRGERDADVPCGDCVGCCVSSYPIPLRPADGVARAEVPEKFLIGPAKPGERWLMGFREDGTCPFLADRICSIYAERPGTCRDYDCRIYAAAGLVPDGDRKVIEQRVRAWKFSYRDDQDRAEAAAVRRAAAFIRGHREKFPAEMRAGSATAAAVLAVRTCEVFLEPGNDCLPAELLVERVVQAARDFDASLPDVP